MRSSAHEPMHALLTPRLFQQPHHQVGSQIVKFWFKCNYSILNRYPPRHINSLAIRWPTSEKTRIEPTLLGHSLSHAKYVKVQD